MLIDDVAQAVWNYYAPTVTLIRQAVDAADLQRALRPFVD